MVFQVITLYTLVNIHVFQTTWQHTLEHQSLTIHEILSLLTGCNKRQCSLSMSWWLLEGIKVKVHLFLTSAIDGERITSCPSCFTYGTEHLYPLNGRLGGPHSQAGLFGEQIHLFTLTGFKPDRQTQSQITILATVPQLPCLLVALTRINTIKSFVYLFIYLFIYYYYYYYYYYYIFEFPCIASL